MLFCSTHAVTTHADTPAAPFVAPMEFGEVILSPEEVDTLLREIDAFFSFPKRVWSRRK